MTLARIPSYCAVVFIPRSSPTSKDHLTQLSLCATSATHAWPDQMATIFFAFSTRLARKVGLSHAFPPLHRIFFLKKHVQCMSHRAKDQWRTVAIGFPALVCSAAVRPSRRCCHGQRCGDLASGRDRKQSAIYVFEKEGFYQPASCTVTGYTIIYIYTPKVWSSNLLHEDFTTTTRGFPGL